ncbi:MAG TPA: hypothetical protein VHT91_18420 [Kofleriaceae bacterium]|jgi:hypothetical protein|nr:hypothetical protein [Kofleriaceae bacterium]
MGGRGSPSVVTTSRRASRRASRRGVAVTALAGVTAITACGARPPPAPAAIGDEIALYRDRALIAQRVELVAPRAGPTAIALRLPAGVDPVAVQVLDGGGLADAALRATAGELAATAPHPGRFTVTLGYISDRLAWDTAYTVTTTAARDRATVRGVIAIRNTTGVELRARTWVVDSELGAWRDHTAEQLRVALHGAPGAASGAVPHDLGTIALRDGETRIELIGAAAPHRLRSVLVYDPIGPGLDHAGAVPVADPSIGVASGPPGQVRESFELARAPGAARGLPAGPARLLERRPDGGLELLGQTRLFDAATRVAEVDTIAVGTARGVTGHRERRDWARDDELRRFTEEFLITIDNTLPHPVDVVLREHLYRGQNWTLAYQSAPAVKEGPQQIALRTTVPASSQAKVLYVVVYTW